MSSESFMEFTKEISHLVRLIAFIAFNDSFGWNYVSNGLMNEI